MTTKRELQDAFDNANNLTDAVNDQSDYGAMNDAWDAYWDLVNALSEDEYEEYFDEQRPVGAASLGPKEG